MRIKILFLLFCFQLVMPCILLAQSLTDRESLYYTCKIWGFLKYHHPAITGGKLDWDQELFVLLDNVKKAKTKNERNTTFVNWVSKLELVKNMKQYTIQDSTLYTQFPDYSWIGASELGDELVSILMPSINADRKKNSRYIQLAEYNNRALFVNEKEYDLDFNDRNIDKYTLLSLFRFWNAFNYFAPYKNYTDISWDDVLWQMIPIFQNIKDRNDYKNSLKKLSSYTCDSHTYVEDNYENKVNENTIRNTYAVSVLVEYIENKAVVTDFRTPSGVECGLRKGDIILERDGVNIINYVDSLRPYYAASNFDYRTNILHLLGTPSEKEMEIKLIRDKDTLYVNVKPVIVGALRDDTKRKSCTFICDSIPCLYLAKMTGKELPIVMSQIKSRSGIIIDLRCYPTIFGYENYIYPRFTHFAKSSRANPLHPGYIKFHEERAIGKNNRDYYKGKIVVLVNWMTISAGEFLTMILQAAPNTIVIGSQTAGADGNITSVPLPGDYEITFSGVGVYYPDGGKTQRVGVRIDEIVKPTIKGIREGRDEVLERAIEIINSQE